MFYPYSLFFGLIDYLEAPDDALFNPASPCYEGDGFARVLSVGPAKSFQSIVIGLATFIHAAYLLYILKNGSADSSMLDKLEGVGYMIVVMLLITAVFWGTQDLTEQEFVHHGNTTEKNSGTSIVRHFYPNKSLLATFAAQTTFSTFGLLSELGIVYALMFWKDELIADGGSFSNFDSYSGDNIPAPYAGAGNPEPGHYSDL